MCKLKSIRILILSMVILSIATKVFADSTSVIVSCSTVLGAVNEKSWGIAAPDKYTWWAGNENLEKRISDANIKIIRVGPVQLGNYTGHDVYPSIYEWNWTDMDAILNTIWEAGAQPLFLVCGYPGGIEPKDWYAYADFMEGVVDRYNVKKELGESKTIKYWEMWNEPTNEGDGKLTKEEYKTFVEIVGSIMKKTDPSIKLIGPADAWSNLGSDGYVAYAAKNLKNYIDILSWHDYGPSPDQNDANRLSWTKQHYQKNMLIGQTSFGAFKSAITEYNISHSDGGDEYNLKYHNEFSATFMASAIINAMYGNAELFTAYTLAETGKNILGLLNNNDYSPYKPYYSLYLFGNFTGHQIIKSTSSLPNLECITSKDTLNNHYFITLVNKSTDKTTYDVTFNMTDISSSSGNVIARVLDSEKNPDVVAGVFSYSNSKFNYPVAPLSVVNIEVSPVITTDAKSFNLNSSELKLFSNPVSGNSFDICLPNSTNNHLNIYNLSGELVFSKAIKNVSIKGEKHKIDITSLPKGTYILKYTNSKKNTVQKFIRD